MQVKVITENKLKVDLVSAKGMKYKRQVETVRKNLKSVNYQMKYLFLKRKKMEHEEKKQVRWLMKYEQGFVLCTSVTLLAS